jgi:hypothetical protein
MRCDDISSDARLATQRTTSASHTQTRAPQRRRSRGRRCGRPCRVCFTEKWCSPFCLPAGNTKELHYFSVKQLHRQLSAKFKCRGSIFAVTQFGPAGDDFSLSENLACRSWSKLRQHEVACCLHIQVKHVRCVSGFFYLTQQQQTRSVANGSAHKSRAHEGGRTRKGGREEGSEVGGKRGEGAGRGRERAAVEETQENRQTQTRESLRTRNKVGALLRIASRLQMC